MSRPVPNVSVIVSSPPPALTMLRFVSSNSPVVPGTGSWPLYVALPGSMTSFLAPALMVSEPGPVVIVSPPSCAAPAEPGGDETAETFVGRMRALRHDWEPVTALRLPSTPTTPVTSHVAANSAPANSGVPARCSSPPIHIRHPSSGRRRGRSRTGRRWRRHREADSRRPRSSCAAAGNRGHLHTQDPICYLDARAACRRRSRQEHSDRRREPPHLANRTPVSRPARVSVNGSSARCW